jgi:tetratricopeptide (TPR) repeat protein
LNRRQRLWPSFGALAILAWLATPAAAERSLVDAQAEVTAAVYAASVTQAAAQKALTVKIKALRAQVEALSLKVRSGEAQRTQLLAAQAKFIAEVAATSGQAAEQIASFKLVATEIAATPEGAAALRLYNSGDRVAALKAIHDLNTQLEASRPTDSAAVKAERRREEAELAFDARMRGDVHTDAVIADFEAVIRLDPTVSDDWAYLRQLYRESGRIGEAKTAAYAAVKTAKTNQSRSIAQSGLSAVLVAAGELAGASSAAEAAVGLLRASAQKDPSDLQRQIDLADALSEAGDVKFAQGDLANARKDDEECHAIVRQAAANSNDEGLQRRLSYSWTRLGDLSVAQANPAAALAAYNADIEIARRLAADDPSDLAKKRDVAVTLGKIGDLRFQQKDVAGARRAFEGAAASSRDIAQSDPANLELQRDLSVDLEKVGDAESAQHDYVGADASFNEAIAIERKLGRLAPTNLEFQRDLSVSTSKRADSLADRGDTTGARQAYEEVLAITRRLAAAEPDSADIQRDLWLGMWRLADIGGSSVSWADVKAQMEALDRRGLIFEEDRSWLEYARKRVGQGG